MDQGIAGLIGAGIGAFFGAGGAVGAAWLARGAVLRQADQQADAAQAQWRRTVRRDACVEYIRVARAYAAAAEDFYLEVGPVCEEDDAEWDQREPERGRLRAAMDDAHRVMTGASVTLELEAPPGLVSEIEDLNTAALNVFVMGFMRNYAASEANMAVWEQHRQQVKSLLPKVVEFARAAKAHLDD
ncbi:hypothetical protein [Streptomyces sp. NBC_00443]|uniref:hypothetical protein n=1 Tax=Streptomyces sp. NBC_00443 TaxID=2975743 RepID=UPI002E1A9F35